jgi:hypothetical protein
MKTIVFISSILLSLNAYCDSDPSLFKEIGRKTKLDPKGWLKNDQRSLAIDVTFYIQERNLQIQHISIEDPKLKEAIESSLNKIILKGKYKEFRMYTLRLILEEEK